MSKRIGLVVLLAALAGAWVIWRWCIKRPKPCDAPLDVTAYLDNTLVDPAVPECNTGRYVVWTSPAADCRAVGDISAPGGDWNLASDGGPLCVFERAGAPTPQAIDALRAHFTGRGRPWHAEPDCRVVVVSAPAVPPGELATAFGGVTDAASGAVGAAQAKVTGTVRVAVVDDDEPIDGTLGHGPSMNAIIGRLACPVGSSCPVVTQVFDVIGPTKTATTMTGPPMTGTQLQLADGIHQAIAWAGKDPLVINLSLGWFSHHLARQNPTGPSLVERTVRQSIVRARCRGAVVFAANGNSTAQSDQVHEATRTPTEFLPAAWQVQTTTVASGTGPLVYAVAGHNSLGYPLATSLDRLPALTAIGQHEVARRLWSGSSVATAVASAIVAHVWQRDPTKTGDMVVGLAYDGGRSLQDREERPTLPLSPSVQMPALRSLWLGGALERAGVSSGAAAPPWGPVRGSPVTSTSAAPVPTLPDPPEALIDGALSAAEGLLVRTQPPVIRCRKCQCGKSMFAGDLYQIKGGLSYEQAVMTLKYVSPGETTMTTMVFPKKSPPATPFEQASLDLLGGDEERVFGNTCVPFMNGRTLRSGYIDIMAPGDAVAVRNDVLLVDW